MNEPRPAVARAAHLRRCAEVRELYAEPLHVRQFRQQMLGQRRHYGRQVDALERRREATFTALLLQLEASAVVSRRALARFQQGMASR